MRISIRSIRYICTVFFSIIFLLSCAHNSPLSIDWDDGRKMYFEYSKDKVIDASITVLKEHNWTVTEINKTENFIKVKKSSRLARSKIRLQLIYKAEGSGTWLEIKKKIPPQYLPGNTNKYKMEINDLFHHINIELDRR